MPLGLPIRFVPPRHPKLGPLVEQYPIPENHLAAPPPHPGIFQLLGQGIRETLFEFIVSAIFAGTLRLIWIAHTWSKDNGGDGFVVIDIFFCIY